jgi:hypothetical protein
VLIWLGDVLSDGEVAVGFPLPPGPGPEPLEDESF